MDLNPAVGLNPIVDLNPAVDLNPVVDLNSVLDLNPMVDLNSVVDLNPVFWIWLRSGRWSERGAVLFPAVPGEGAPC